MREELRSQWSTKSAQGANHWVRYQSLFCICVFASSLDKKKNFSFLYLRFPMTIAIFCLLSFSDKSILNKPFYKCNFHVFRDKLRCLVYDTLLLDVKNV